MARAFSVDCCEGATAQVVMKERAAFMAGVVKDHRIICSVCCRELKPFTTTKLVSIS